MPEFAWWLVPPLIDFAYHFALAIAAAWVLEHLRP
jgi:hypothetical protein